MSPRRARLLVRPRVTASVAVPGALGPVSVSPATSKWLVPSSMARPSEQDYDSSSAPRRAITGVTGGAAASAAVVIVVLPDRARRLDQHEPRSRALSLPQYRECLTMRSFLDHYAVALRRTRWSRWVRHACHCS